MKQHHFAIIAISLSTILQATVPCESGRASGHQCSQVNLASKLDLGRSGLAATSGNDIWGWTDPDTGREYALVGLSSKTAFVDVTEPEAPVHIGDLATASVNSIWRDIKVYQDHAFIVSEAYRHGMQVFDLKKLRDRTDLPKTFTADAHYTNISSTHNIAINEDTGYAYLVGTNTCDEGMHVVDIRDPKQPVFSTCIDKTIFEPVPSSEGAGGLEDHGEDYTHDAQCVIYRGPDARYQGKEVCVCSNADTVNIVDVTNKADPSQISVKTYEGMGYTHQGWLTEDHKYFILGDELDEKKFGHNTKTIIWDVTDLAAPKVIGQYFSSQKAIDHNLYVRGNLLFQSNYEAGLRILSLDRVAEGKLEEVGFFDTVPESDKAEFTGAWSVYPYFASGHVVLSNIDGYLYVLTPTGRAAVPSL